MIVTGVNVTIYQHPMPPLHGARWGGMQETSLVEVTIDVGIVGYASARAQGGSGGRAIAESILKTAAPTAPGLGIEIDWEWVKANQVPL